MASDSFSVTIKLLRVLYSCITFRLLVHYSRFVLLQMTTIVIKTY